MKLGGLLTKLSHFLKRPITHSLHNHVCRNFIIVSHYRWLPFLVLTVTCHLRLRNAFLLNSRFKDTTSSKSSRDKRRSRSRSRSRRQAPSDRELAFTGGEADGKEEGGRGGGDDGALVCHRIQIAACFGSRFLT